MWGRGVASREVLDCVGGGGRGVEDFRGCWGAVVMGGVGMFTGFWFRAGYGMLEIARGLA